MPPRSATGFYRGHMLVSAYRYDVAESSLVWILSGWGLWFRLGARFR
jgi:hypothetical protein